MIIPPYFAATAKAGGYDTEYVRQEWVKELRRRIVTHKRFKRLVDQWIDLSIEHSRLTMRIAEPKATR